MRQDGDITTRCGSWSGSWGAAGGAPAGPLPPPGTGVGPDLPELRKKGFDQPPEPLSHSLPHRRGPSPQKEVKGAPPGLEADMGSLGRWLCSPRRSQSPECGGQSGLTPATPLVWGRAPSLCCVSGGSEDTWRPPLSGPLVLACCPKALLGQTSIGLHLGTWAGEGLGCPQCPGASPVTCPPDSVLRGVHGGDTLAAEAGAETDHLLFSFLSNWREARLKARAQEPAHWVARPPAPHIRHPPLPTLSRRLSGAENKATQVTTGITEKIYQGHQIVKTQEIMSFQVENML